jgi:hypothetical protein
MRPGVYTLSRDVQNPAPDRRIRTDWRFLPVWDRGSLYIVTPTGDGRASVAYRVGDPFAAGHGLRIETGHPLIHALVPADALPPWDAARAEETWREIDPSRGPDTSRITLAALIRRGILTQAQADGLASAYYDLTDAEGDR